MRSRADLVAAFHRAMPDRVAQATDLWLGFEQGQAGNLPVLRRLLHTLKGEAHMLELAACGDLAELTETVIDAVRGGARPTQLTGDSLLGALEALGLLSASAGEAAALDLGPVQETLRAAHAELTGASAPAGGPAPRPAATESALPPRLDPADAPDPAAPPAALDAAAVGALLHEMQRLHGEREVLQRRLREAQRMLRALLVEIDPRGAAADRVAERITKTLGYGAEIERLLGAVRADWSSNEFAAGRALGELDEVVRRASVVRTERLLNQVSLAARSAARMLGKDVEVRVEGTGLLDAAVERRLEPALLHLVRNAVDHGIEPADVRARRGKPGRGAVAVTVVQTDAAVRVEVKDDGGGVDFARLREVLAEAVPDVASLDDAELIPYLFAHGLTTTRSVGAISGRGVGLDVVAREIGALGGQVRVDSRPGLGTTILLVVPKSPHGEEVVPVTCGRFRCAVPTHAVHSVMLLEELLHTSDGPRVRLAGGSGVELVPLYALGAVLGDGGQPAPGDAALVLHHAAGLFAVSVDGYENPRLVALVRSEELPWSSPLVRGVAPTADGEAMLLLDVERVFAWARQAPREAPARAAAAAPKREPLALVVEDAPVARELLSGILRAIGLRVEEASDGREGLARARAAPPDVVLTDLEMPYMNGLEMVAELRRTPALARVPVVVLTTQTAATHAENVAALRALGVRAVLSKQRFVEEELRRIVAESLGGA
ncbi:response regulator [Sorangium cellulosum]|uniref:histidine kinase n=1 Tax=Sorangium cellulosum So0157-2 TaxID=1254432 RepID=S4XHW1_SORCE|nr:response regulator [Sorangium cellulosum]AGP32126.1 chemotaxis protein CheY [Sorangium cellulosum So0157-2]